MDAFVAPIPLARSSQRGLARRSPGAVRASARVRRRPRLTALATPPADEEFILPRLDRDTLEGLADADRAAPSTISEIRRREKTNELRRKADRVAEDDEEARRRQLAGEKLSAADLFGSAAPDAVPEQVASVPVARSAPAAQRARKARPAPPPAAAAHVARQVQRAKTILGESSAGSVLTPGAVVNHARHGFGRFRGLERTVEKRRRGGMQPDQLSKEFAVIEYRDGDVYVPLAHLDLVKVVDAADTPDRLDSISGVNYARGEAGRNARNRKSKFAARIKTRARIRQQLVNLNDLYTSRLTQSRPVFSVDDAAERRFSDACGFALTKDQATATAEVLDDLSVRTRPMDRLLCGDVGFGKTEVAMRAAFRVLKAGRQVALLAPTTILAQQHYETFRDRFEESFPEIRIACLTRFTRRATVLEERELLATGEISVAVGTHMLLGDNISFKNLGLLIVDEENRWGVNQKEKLRVRYSGVDTLILSATPIPRTLHLALSGLKDTSVLSTPPPGRKAVITQVVQSGPGIVRNAIQREIDRKGQVFYVVPRIEGIETAAAWLRELLPDLRVIVAHGSTSRLERKIWSFAQYEYDVLVCTTIIENGINLPRVNTMIVQDAGRFGLAQLHQLRGRVGRCDIQAYAFLMFSKTGPGDRSLSELRLQTLEKHSDLGSGFVIAQKDMEMRGVGTVLGVEQHGNTAVGPEEYGRMLAEELAFARTGEPIPLSIPSVTCCEIFLPVASFIPAEYIGDNDLKMMAYASMSAATTVSQLTSLASMLESKFGPLPTPTRLHMSVLEVKVMAKEMGISRIFSERQHVVLDWAISHDALKFLVKTLPDQRVRDRFQHVEEEEKILVRGLGICGGDVQLAKIREYILAFSGVAKRIKANMPTAAEIKIENVLKQGL